MVKESKHFSIKGFFSSVTRLLAYFRKMGKRGMGAFLILHQKSNYGFKRRKGGAGAHGKGPFVHR